MTFFDNDFFKSPFFNNDFFNNDFFKEPFFKGFKSKPIQPLPKPADVTGERINGRTTTSIDVSWDPAAHATNYKVDITPTAPGYPKVVSTPHNNFTGLKIITNYSMTIQACNAGGCSKVITIRSMTPMS